MERLSRSDLEAVLDFAGEVVASAREPERQGERLVAGIARMADVDVNLVLYGRIDATYRAHDVTLLGDQPRPSSDEFVDAARSDENPYLAHAARTDQPYFRATRLHDLVDREAFRRTRLYQLMPLADVPSAQMRMPAQGGSWWQLEVLRPGRQFTDRQLALLDAARPWLELYEDRRVLAAQVAAIRAASRTSAPRPCSRAASSRCSTGSLTARRTRTSRMPCTSPPARCASTSRTSTPSSR